MGILCLRKDLILVNFFVKSFAVDPQNLGGLALVAAGFFQDIEDMFFFDIF